MASVTVICTGCEAPFIAQRRDAQYCSECSYTARLNRQQRFELTHKHPCLDCGAFVYRRFLRCKVCSNKTRDNKGEKNPSWKGGRVNMRGYIYVTIPYEAGKLRYSAEHRLVFEAANGTLPKGYVVHHLNGVKTDNRLENLIALPQNKHHTHPRETLHPYEQRISRLEAKLATMVESLPDISN